MTTVILILVIAALIAFVVEAFQLFVVSKVNLIALGLALLTTVWLLGLLH